MNRIYVEPEMTVLELVSQNDIVTASVCLGDGHQGQGCGSTDSYEGGF